LQGLRNARWGLVHDEKGDVVIDGRRHEDGILRGSPHPVGAGTDHPPKIGVVVGGGGWFGRNRSAAGTGSIVTVVILREPRVYAGVAGGESEIGVKTEDRWVVRVSDAMRSGHHHILVGARKTLATYHCRRALGSAVAREDADHR